MTGRNRRNFSPEFRLEAAQLVLDQHYIVDGVHVIHTGGEYPSYIQLPERISVV
jgi:hypothetical protein